jgi:hypothetical protein
VASQTLEKHRPSGGRYSTEEVEQGVTALALMNGNAGRAHRELRALGVQVPRRTLGSWTRIHADRYEAIKRDVVPRIHRRMADQAEELADRYAEAELTALERLVPKLQELKPAEVTGALRNLATSRGISVDKSLLLRGQPNMIVQHHHDIEADLRMLQSLGVADVVDSTAEEVGG